MQYNFILCYNVMYFARIQYNTIWIQEYYSKPNQNKQLLALSLQSTPHKYKKVADFLAYISHPPKSRWQKVWVYAGAERSKLCGFPQPWFLLALGTGGIDLWYFCFGKVAQHLTCYFQLSKAHGKDPQEEYTLKLILVFDSYPWLAQIVAKLSDVQCV